jgi:hypothetical protein
MEKISREIHALKKEHGQKHGQFDQVEQAFDEGGFLSV